MSLDYDDWDNSLIWQSILKNKSQHFEDTTTDPKNLDTWPTQVLNPRRITLIDGTDSTVLPMLETAFQTWNTGAERPKFEPLVISLNPTSLAYDAVWHMKTESSKVEWEAGVYQEHFIWRSELTNDTLKQSRAVFRSIQPRLRFRNHLVIPSPHDSQRCRHSNFPVEDAKIWAGPTSLLITGGGEEKSAQDDEDEQDKVPDFRPDQTYTCQISAEDRASLRECLPLPAFRASAEFAKTTRLTPIYFIVEYKPKQQDFKEAENYMLLFSATETTPSIARYRYQQAISATRYTSNILHDLLWRHNASLPD